MQMVTMALGSCLGIVLYDGEIKVGAMAHVMHPYRDGVKNNSNKAKFVDSAIAVMLGKMQKRGARRKRIIAKIFGGACMFDHVVNNREVLQIGDKNVKAARDVLEQLDIAIAGESVGGNTGRTICFNLADGTVVVRDAFDNKERY
ncbi:MAG: chemotaxis protein CheD [bacterium]|nr:MAG: chemotaxis protein CheD [bacterium]